MSSSKRNCATGSSPEQKAAFNVCYRQTWRNRACPCSKLEPLVKAANSARISFKCLLSITYVKHYMPNEWSINRTKYESSSNFDLWKGDYRGLHCTNKSLFRKFLFSHSWRFHSYLLAQEFPIFVCYQAIFWEHVVIFFNHCRQAKRQELIISPICLMQNCLKC